MAFLLFRSMKVDSGDRPVCESTPRGLGVRPDIDIPVHDGIVEPGTGGLSVAPDTPQNLPLFRRPASLGGTGRDVVWRIVPDSLPDSLVFRRDREDHGLIEPSRTMRFEEYNQALCETALQWTRT